MSTYSFDDGRKEYNGRGEGYRGSFESSLREDTFQALSAVNEVVGGRQDVVEIVQRNGEEYHGREPNFHRLADASLGQVDQSNQLGMVGARLGTYTSVDVPDASHCEQKSGSRRRGSEVQQTGRGRNRPESTGAFKVWTMGMTEIVDGADRNLGQGEGNDCVATALNVIEERSRRHMRRLEWLASTNVSNQPQKESKERPAEGPGSKRRRASASNDVKSNRARIDDQPPPKRMMRITIYEGRSESRDENGGHTRDNVQMYTSGKMGNRQKRKRS